MKISRYIPLPFLLCCFVLTPPPLMLCVCLQIFDAALFLEEEEGENRVLQSTGSCVLLILLYGIMYICFLLVLCGL